MRITYRIFIALFILIIVGCSSNQTVIPNLKEVESVTLAFYPEGIEVQQLHSTNESDQKIIKNIGDWIAKGTVVKGDTHISPHASPKLILKMIDGKSITVVKAVGTSKQIVIFNADKSVLMNAPELYNWLESGWEKDLQVK